MTEIKIDGASPSEVGEHGFSQSETDKSTLTVPSGVEPAMKIIENDVLRSRIVVVSPYMPLNLCLETEIPKIIDGGFVDIVHSVESTEPPYINVDEKEKHTQKPLWIIDFGKILTFIPNSSAIAEGRAAAIDNLFVGYRKYLQQPIESLTEDCQNLGKYPLDTSVLREIYVWLGKRFASFLGANLKDVLQIADKNLPANFAEIPHMLDFDGYAKWARKNVNSVLYLTPTFSFSKLLEERAMAGNEGANVVDMRINDFQFGMLSDLETIVHNPQGSCHYFDVGRYFGPI